MPGMGDTLQNLFPSRFVDSPLGRIPENYTVKNSEEIFDIGIGRTPPRKESEWFTSALKGIPWLSIRDMGRFTVFSGATSEGLTQDAVRKFNIPIVPQNTVLMSFKLTVGKLCITSMPMTTNEAIAHFVPKSGNYLSPYFIFFWLRNFDMKSLDSTSSIGNATNSKLLRKIPFLMPDRRIIQKFDEIAEPMFKLVQLHTLETNARSSGDELDIDLET